MEFALFILISVGLIIVPGPNVLVIISTTLSHGRRRGLQTVAGTSLAMVLQLLVAAIGTAWLVAALGTGFIWLKWLGVAYLLYLGINHLLAAARSRPARTLTALGSFQRGFWVSLTNPKTILFFSAFLPQFVTSTDHYVGQIALLSAIFWILALSLDSLYALLSGWLAEKAVTAENAGRMMVWQHLFSGALYTGAGIVLATIRRTA